MNSGSQGVKVLTSMALCAVAVIVCVCMIFNFTVKRGSYESKVAYQSGVAAEQNKKLKENHNNIVKANSDIDKYNREIESLGTELEQVKNEYNRISNYDDAKIAYLTFDDGPSENTLRILKVLKDNNVKATFFVTGNDRIEYMKNIVADGHTIALHTYCHDYDKIYRSTDAYFRDLERIHDLVKKQTGVDARVIRFPGGSSNTISREYDGGIKIMSKLTKMVGEKNYVYFDWNCDSSDASGNGVAKEKLVSHTLGEATQNHICVLMHDTGAKDTTADALPEIISGLRKKGYSFDKLTENTPDSQFHHGVNN